MRTQIKDNKGTGESPSIHAREAWDRLYARLHDEQLIPAQDDRVKVYPIFNGLRMAAAVILMLAGAVLVYLLLDRKPEAPLLSLGTGPEPGTLVRTLEDGSVVYLAQNSVFSFPGKFSAASRKVGLKGEAFFDIAADPVKPFIIETGEARVQVLGTAFGVKARQGVGFGISVERGKVRVNLNSDPGHPQMIMAGELVSLSGNSLLRSEYDTVPGSRWYLKCIRFKDEKLADIISVLNRNFSINFVLADRSTGQRRLTVAFREETPGSMRDLLCMALNLKSQTINGSIVLSEIRGGSKP